MSEGYRCVKCGTEALLVHHDDKSNPVQAVANCDCGVPIPVYATPDWISDYFKCREKAIQVLKSIIQAADLMNLPHCLLGEKYKLVLNNGGFQDLIGESKSGSPMVVVSEVKEVLDSLPEVT